MESLISSLFIFLIGAYSSKLYITNTLGLYVHRNSVTFVFAAGIVCMIVGSIGIIRFIVIKNRHSHSNSWFLSYIPLALTLSLGLFIPPKSLSVTSGQVVAVPQANIPTKKTESLEESIKKNYGPNTDIYTFEDWAHVLLYKGGVDFMNNKKGQLIGFIMKSPDLPQNIFFVARNIITCCAIDARPIGIAVDYESAPTLAESKWVEVSGHFEKRTKDGHDKIVLITEKVTPVEQPKNPYIYY